MHYSFAELECVMPSAVVSLAEGWLLVLTGLGWAVWFEHVQNQIAAKEPEVAAKLQGYQRHSGSAAALSASDEETVPWRGFLRSRPVQALAYAHFCNNW